MGALFGNFIYYKKVLAKVYLWFSVYINITYALKVNNNSIFIAATNYESLLDAAIWRRFDEVLFFDKPDFELRKNLLEKKLVSIRHQGINIEKTASRLQDATGADIERICSDAIKSVILKSQNLLTASDLEEALQRHLARIRIIETSTNIMEKNVDC